MEPEIDENNESVIDLEFVELSKDSALYSLFNQCVMEVDNPQIDHEQLEQNNFLPHQLNVDPQMIERGYWSDCFENPQKSQTRKHKNIINKKEKKRTKHRTRMYIEMLENRVNELQSELEKLKKLNKINKEYIHRLGESEHMINGFFIGRQQLYEKLDASISATPVNEKQTFEVIESLRLRQGVFGKDRIKAVNYYFKEMIELILPEIQKYVVKTAVQQSDFFDQEFLINGQHRQDTEKWRKNMLQKIDIGSESQNMRRYLVEKRPKILQETKKFQEILSQFYEKKCMLSTQARKIEQIFDDAHCQMNIEQISQALCYIDRYRFQKNITIEQFLPTTFQKVKQENFGYSLDNVFPLTKAKKQSLMGGKH